MTKFDRVLTKVDCPNSIGVFDMGQMGQFKIKSSAFIVWKKLLSPVVKTDSRLHHSIRFSMLAIEVCKGTVCPWLPMFALLHLVAWGHTAPGI